MRMEQLEQRLVKLLDDDFPTACDGDNPAAALLLIRREEQLIGTGLSALRLLRAVCFVKHPMLRLHGLNFYVESFSTTESLR